MSILWKSGTWRWLARKSRESKPFFFAFAMVCGVVPGVAGYCAMKFTSSRNEELEAKLRKTASPDTMGFSRPFLVAILCLSGSCNARKISMTDTWLLSEERV